MPASPSTARAINDRLALRHFQEQGPLTAAQLKTLTGLSRPSVADLVERLQGAGLVRVVGESGGERRGPNARVYGIAADRAHLAGLDIRTGSVFAVVADLLGRTLAEAAAPVDERTDPEEAAEHARDLLERTVEQAGATRLHSVAVGAPGLVDPASGELRDTSGLPAWHRRLVAALPERLGARVLVENETNLAAVAEQRIGAARGHQDFALLWLGLSVGAAVVIDGRLRRGVSGGAGEVSFLPVPGATGTPSATGCDGGLHSLVNSDAVCELAARHGIDAHPAAHEPAAAAYLRAASSTGGAGGAGGAFLDELADRVALGAAALTTVLDPGLVVLSGELGHAGGAGLAARVERRLAAICPLRTEVAPSGLGGAAVLRGALLTARDAAQHDLFGPER
ncbi:ROK family transcriptional regulator [Streptomyces montanisoli]|uniref:ROK family transcriptional regulator n=1 Tax=Streptomyces montanisoli TaxID=2798581 RepID=A0A940MEK4_9ACTN|nr:ROK family transcriptional regulator [Streptomyces montanisoli]MBP0459814.1 ROK family transcriptional regulator [Streptomyces montanisoli]